MTGPTADARTWNRSPWRALIWGGAAVALSIPAIAMQFTDEVQWGPFDFLVMGKRSAMPEHLPIRENRHFLPEPGTVIAEGELPGRYRELLIQNGTLEPDGRVSAASAALRERAQAEHDGVAGEAALPARD